MKNVAPREYRIRQVSPSEFVTEERIQKKRRIFTASGWSRLAYDGSVATYSATQNNVIAAHEAIRRRKERLLRADEFPVVVAQFSWDGTVHDIRMVG